MTVGVGDATSLDVIPERHIHPGPTTSKHRKTEEVNLVRRCLGYIDLHGDFAGSSACNTLHRGVTAGSATAARSSHASGYPARRVWPLQSQQRSAVLPTRSA